ncbi:MAG: hypothetical protein HY367_04285 [Candidatus Aenigmarchaeota archaeon]|nr:hypothetical protein [Candidatus Aenigmarchaeota archaeon]
MKLGALLTVMVVAALAFQGTAGATVSSRGFSSCAVRITQFDVTNFIEEDSEFTVTFTVFNFGTKEARVTVTLLEDNRIIRSLDKTLLPGESNTGSLTFIEDDKGDHTLQLKAEANTFGCSSADSEFTRLTVEPATTGCSITFDDFDLDRDLDRENLFHMFADIRNDGRVTEEVRMDVLVESRLVHTQRFTLKRNEAFLFTRDFSFNEAGTFRIVARVKAFTEDCFAERQDSELARVNPSDLTGQPPATQPPGTAPTVGSACSLFISRFDFPDSIVANRPATATAEVSNTGLLSESVSLVLTVDGRIAATENGIVEPDRLLTKNLQFSVPAGLHTVTLEANSVAGTCANRDRIAVNVNSIDVIRTVGPSPAFETPSPQPELSVDFPLESFDVELGAGKAVPIDIAAIPGRTFTMDVSGVPQDWLDFGGEFEVSGRDTVYVFVAPKETGDYSIEIEVEGGGRTFRETVSFFVSKPSTGTVGTLGDTFRSIYNALADVFSDQKVQLLTLAAAVLVLLFLAAARLRR